MKIITTGHGPNPFRTEQAAAAAPTDLYRVFNVHHFTDGSTPLPGTRGDPKGLARLPRTVPAGRLLVPRRGRAELGARRDVGQLAGHVFWSTCLSLRVKEGHTPRRTWAGSNVGFRGVLAVALVQEVHLLVPVPGRGPARHTPGRRPAPGRPGGRAARAGRRPVVGEALPEEAEQAPGRRTASAHQRRPPSSPRGRARCG